MINVFYLNCFFVYSILGYLFETIMGIITKTNYKSGFMHGPYAPIYGIGVVVILLLSDYLFKNLHMPRWKETIIVFIVLSIFLTCLEALGGVLIEKTFHVVFWDYTSKRFNIGKYICLEMMLIWGIATTTFIYLINPLFENLIKKIPSFASIIFGILMLFDFIYTLFTGVKK